MIKTIAFLYRNPALTHAEFREYWTNTHVPLVRSLLPGLTLYRGCFPLSDDPDNPLACDAVVELGWADKETMDREMSAPEFNTPRRIASSEHLMDLSKGKSLLVEEVEIDLG